MEKQKEEFPEIYDKGVKALEERFTHDENDYQIDGGILFIFKEDRKILVPEALVSVLISYAHLRSAHGGYNKMKLLLSNYYAVNLLIRIKYFVQRCYSCMLVNIPTRQEKLGFYFPPPYPFHTLHLDLAESLGKETLNQFQHLLICTCDLTGAILIFPLKGKTGSEFLSVFLTSIYQTFAPKILLTDNGTVFINKQNLRLLASLGVSCPKTSAFSPRSKGIAESAVRIIKTALKKFNVENGQNRSWVYLCVLITRLYNTTPIAKTRVPPFKFIFPQSHITESILDTLQTPVKPHPLISDEADDVRAMNEAFIEMTQQTKKFITANKQAMLDSRNKNRISRELKEGDLVFTIDRAIPPPGVNKALAPRYSHVPYKVVKVLHTTCLITRLSDTATFQFNKGDLKKIIPHSSEFNDLPEIVRNIVAKEGTTIEAEDIADMIPLSNFNIPDGAIPVPDDDNAHPIEPVEGDLFGDIMSEQISPTEEGEEEEF